MSLSASADVLNPAMGELSAAQCAREVCSGEQASVGHAGAEAFAMFAWIAVLLVPEVWFLLGYSALLIGIVLKLLS